MSEEILNVVRSGAPGVMLVVSAEDLRRVVTDMCRRHEARMEEAAARQKERPTLSRRETSRLLGVSLTTLWRWEVSGYLKPVKIGTKVMYRASDVEGMLERKGAAV